MDYAHIILEVSEEVATITFNRPKALNALNAALLVELAQAAEIVQKDENVRVLVLTGAGDKAFVAGADINELAGLSVLQGKVFAQKGQAVINQIAALPIPVIAAVNGYALGGGTEMALACDFIYAAESASFGLPETNLGLIPGFGGTQRLARLIGSSQAKELIYTGKIVPAAEAKSMGIVNRVFDNEILMDEVLATARQIVAKGRVSIRAAKQTIDKGLNVDLVTGLEIEQDAFSICMASPDAVEGTRAFLDKRKPEFKGRISE